MTIELSNLPFEEAMRELEAIVRKLEEGRLPLDEAIKNYERGAILRTHCENLLKDAKLKVDQIVVSPEGTLSLERSPLEDEI
ncbi:MAG: exodeoxyribonuclease VII small subunit [Candidatus Paracaedimonas acanthamoebae]|uniref:Exodeoxyribonuclease 7 small subunit n=1 Tax=Candidatus Paracaedimonas acanthamoebae TaxID=244581 RepID=A0A8J7Q1K8_9PROT|nr:exodeoxyribonuclease VII small subunit [Candidatus Paracaedimonas acanthamoebae]